MSDLARTSSACDRRVDRARAGRALDRRPGRPRARAVPRDARRPLRPGRREQPGAVGADCRADDQAREWELSKVLGFIDETRPDYIKWDNNFWINCNRAGHGHGSQDGNLRHMRGMQTSSIRSVRRTPTSRSRIARAAATACRSTCLRSPIRLARRPDLSRVTRSSCTEGLLGIFPTPYLLTFVLATAESIDEGRMDDALYVLPEPDVRLAGAVARAAELDDGAPTRPEDCAEQVRPIPPGFLVDSPLEPAGHRAIPTRAGRAGTSSSTCRAGRARPSSWRSTRWTARRASPSFRRRFAGRDLRRRVRRLRPARLVTGPS